jgi:hypothetical protein
VGGVATPGVTTAERVAVAPLHIVWVSGLASIVCENICVVTKNKPAKKNIFFFIVFLICTQMYQQLLNQKKLLDEALKSPSKKCFFRGASFVY